MNFIEKHWYKKGLTWLTILLLPVSYLYYFISIIRKHILISKASKNVGVPIVIVGNINIGGVGKSPFVSSLVSHLIHNDYHPGIVSRGYGGKAESYPLLVNNNTAVIASGDEPKMLYEQTRCPFVVDPNRSEAVKYLCEQFPEVDVVISDDGLQHYKLYRDIEIVIVEGKRRFGNQQIIPAGPLREPVSRLKSVDFLISNGVELPEYYQMSLLPVSVVNITDKSELDLNWLENRQVHAVSGIGNPNRFFSSLKELGAILTEHPYPDHYSFSKDDLTFNDDVPIIMTHKDAVKCENLNVPNMFYLKINANIDQKFYDEFILRLQNCAFAQTVNR
ncbi:tetraacyldisaccharide 4'-kinase [Francisellaceae bacterium]|nr:tetraacyldisaccharide 4'-kinase [Francisellaceae bacterium]